jgi:low affinity Fe/Cu permease
MWYTTSSATAPFFCCLFCAAKMGATLFLIAALIVLVTAAAVLLLFGRSWKLLELTAFACVLAVCIVLLWHLLRPEVLPDDVHVLLKMGMDAMKSKDERERDKAFRYFEKAVSLGTYRDAYFGLAMCYQHGWGTLVNFDEASRFYQHAGDSPAVRTQLGVLAFQKGNENEALPLFQEASNHGYGLASYNLGWMYEHGHGGENNRVDAARKAYVEALRQKIGLTSEQLTEISAKIKALTENSSHKADVPIASALPDHPWQKPVSSHGAEDLRPLMIEQQTLGP